MDHLTHTFIEHDETDDVTIWLDPSRGDNYIVASVRRDHVVPTMWWWEANGLHGRAPDSRETVVRHVRELLLGINPDPTAAGALDGALAAMRAGGDKAEPVVAYVSEAFAAQNADAAGAAGLTLVATTPAPVAEVGPRPVLLWFAAVMERKLAANDHKGGWRPSLCLDLLGRLREEADELEQAIRTSTHIDVIIDEAADVANFAMMIADNIEQMRPGVMKFAQPTPAAEAPTYGGPPCDLCNNPPYSYACACTRPAAEAPTATPTTPAPEAGAAGPGPEDRALAIARTVLALARQDRITLQPDGVTRESVTDHTVMLAVMAAELAPWRLDRGRVLAHAVVHDLVEAYAGDTPTLVALDADARAAKDAREAAALQRIRDEVGPDSWLVRTIEDYERQESPEARWVHALDKCAPKLTHALNGGAAIRAQGVSLEATRARVAGQIAAIRDDLPEARALAANLWQRVEATWSPDPVVVATPAPDVAETPDDHRRALVLVRGAAGYVAEVWPDSLAHGRRSTGPTLTACLQDAIEDLDTMRGRYGIDGVDIRGDACWWCRGPVNAARIPRPVETPEARSARLRGLAEARGWTREAGNWRDPRRCLVAWKPYTGVGAAYCATLPDPATLDDALAVALGEPGTPGEAAALRAEVAAWMSAKATDERTIARLTSERNEARAEVARLRAEAAGLRFDVDAGARARDEVARLTAALADADYRDEADDAHLARVTRERDDARTALAEVLRALGVRRG